MIKIFSPKIKRISFWILAAIVGFFVTKILEWLIPKLEIWKSLIEFFSTMTAPDIVLLILILMNLIFLFLIYNRVKRKELLNTIEKIQEKLKEIQHKMKNVTDFRHGSIEPEKIDLKEEHFTILDALADSKNGCEEKDILFYNHFGKRYRKARRADFNLIISELKRGKLIRRKEDDILDIFPDDETIVCISDIGYTSLRNRKKI